MDNITKREFYELLILAGLGQHAELGTNAAVQIAVTRADALLKIQEPEESE